MKKLTMFASTIIALNLVPQAYAAYCEGFSRIGCYEGADNTGRNPQSLYEAAAAAYKQASSGCRRRMEEAGVARDGRRDRKDTAGMEYLASMVRYTSAYESARCSK